MAQLFRRALVAAPTLAVIAASAVALPNAGGPAWSAEPGALPPEPRVAADALPSGYATWLSSLAIEPEPPIARWLQPAEEDLTPGIDDDGRYKNLYRTFTLSGGFATFAKFNTNIQVSGDASVGADIDMEELLGLDDSSGAARVDMHYAFNRRHWLELSYYDIRRDGSRTIEDDIQVGDVLIPAGETDTHFNTLILKLAYRYNFVTDTRTVIGASFGLHVMGIDTAIRSPSFDVEEDFKVTAPLPVFGLHAAYALSEKWKLSASIELLQFDIGDYRGFISDSRLTLDHDMFEYLGWGVGFNGFQANASFDSDDLSADLDYGYQGVMIYLRVLF